MKFKHSLPAIYHSLLPKPLLDADLTEHKATCSACAMAPSVRGPRAKITYEPHLKCCTFEPFIPNFWVGALLKEEMRFPHGVREIRRKIANREGALPIGLVPRLSFQVEFNHREKHEFGNRADWLCPYYHRESDNCGIWKYRGAVCTSFFCQSDFGKPGERLWRKMSDYLSYAEMGLMEDALSELGFSPRQVSDLLDYVNRSAATKEELRSASLPAKEFRRLWDGYEENEIEDFYRKCYDKALAFDRSRFQELAGELGEKMERGLLAQLRRVQERGRDDA